MHAFFLICISFASLYAIINGDVSSLLCEKRYFLQKKLTH